MDCKTTPTLAEAVRAESVTSLIGRAAAAAAAAARSRAFLVWAVFIG